MEIKPNDIGKLVELPIKPDWGPGKIMKIEKGYAFVHFRDDGDRMAKKYAVGENPLIPAAEQSDPVLDVLSSVAPKRRRAPAPVPARLDFNQALEFFTARYPAGFLDPAYLEDASNEKTGWEHPARLFQEYFGTRQLEAMIDNRSYEVISGRTQALLSAQHFLGKDDLKAFREVLVNHSATMVYFDALNKVLKDWNVVYDNLQPYFETMLAGPVQGFAKWPNATLLPFLAQPNRFMFLKPAAVKSFAASLGIGFLYEPKLGWRTYHSLQEMTGSLLERLKPLGAKDNLDVQAFITVVLESAKQKISF